MIGGLCERVSLLKIYAHDDDDDDDDNDDLNIFM